MTCKLGWSVDQIKMSFGRTDASMNVCDTCSHLKLLPGYDMIHVCDMISDMPYQKIANPEGGDKDQ